MNNQTTTEALRDKVEGIQLRTTQSNPDAGEIVVRINDVMQLIAKEKAFLLENIKRELVLDALPDHHGINVKRIKDVLAHSQEDREEK